MLFNSLHFLIFFPVVVSVFFLIPHRYRWILLLTASYYFYMVWKPEYAVLLIISTLINYFSAIMMDRFRDKGRGYKKFLVFSLVSSLGILFAFKYFNFFSDSARAFFEYFNIFYNSPSFSLLLPIGISFYTFQSLSYTIDVYRGARKPEWHLGIFALYVSFFPQLVAGPIERSTRLLPQFYQKMSFGAERVTSGLRLMLWGFFKKLVIADNAAVIVNNIYGNLSEYNGLILAAATFFFAIQIYADFSGYSDIARGAARVMGYDLMLNFNAPYFSRSVREFWRRWHISLMSWFMDYLYKPLGGSRVAMSRWIANIFIVFSLSGLWHGANWTFIAWGLINAFYIVLSKLTTRLRLIMTVFFRLNFCPRFHSVLQVLTTFTLITFSWIFFRSSNITEAFYIISRIFSDTLASGFNLFSISFVKEMLVSFNVNLYEIYKFAAFIGAIVILGWAELNRAVLFKLFSRPRWFRWAVYYAIILFILFFGYFGEQPFIYFRF